MRKIAGPGHVGNAFVDYDAVTNPDGTVYTADWGNDTQNELVGIQDEFSIAEAAGTNKYVLAAIKGIAIGYGKQIGELFFLDTQKDPDEFDKDSPEDFFPGKCLSTIEDYNDIAVANWAELVPHLRAKAFKYFEGITGETSAFSVVNWAIAANVATLTFSGAAATAMLAALAEDVLVHGSYTHWRSVTLAGAIGDITAGEYAITAVDAAGLTITFAFTAGNNSGAVTATCNFYQHRVPGSTTTARLMQSTGRNLISANDGNGKYIAGLRIRDAMQRITGSASYYTTTHGWFRSEAVVSGVFKKGSTGRTDTAGPLSTTTGYDWEFDNSGSTSPNTAKTDDDETRGPGVAGHLFIWGRSYSS